MFFISAMKLVISSSDEEQVLVGWIPLNSVSVSQNPLSFDLRSCLKRCDHCDSSFPSPNLECSNKRTDLNQLFIITYYSLKLTSYILYSSIKDEKWMDVHAPE